ncbi:phospholipid phosphatase-related protein type 4-like, partial [Seriola lalandi dorsalis]|uniref:phospholipid phosphatase-related protein type 4-like n=1 Tax=Seriola lalandi dorsalis TaxID=1841481 RepID=UPI000C6F66E6
MSAREKGILTKDSVSLLPCFYFVELPILVSSVVSLYFLEWTDVFKPVKSGFTCHDRSLSLPYIDPNHEVIPLLMLLSLAFAGPAITIMIGEAILFCCLSRRKSGACAEANINAAGCNFNSFIRRAVRFVGVHAFGLCATALITDILQLMTGYPTPYFLTVCKPNYTTLNISCEQNPYVMEDICSGSDPAAINQGRKETVQGGPGLNQTGSGDSGFTQGDGSQADWTGGSRGTWAGLDESQFDPCVWDARRFGCR